MKKNFGKTGIREIRNMKMTPYRLIAGFFLLSGALPVSSAMATPASIQRISNGVTHYMSGASAASLSETGLDIALSLDSDGSVFPAVFRLRLTSDLSSTNYELVSGPTSGLPDGPSSRGQISSDGLTVGYLSDATNLGPTDVNSSTDIYFKDSMGNNNLVTDFMTSHTISHMRMSRNGQFFLAQIDEGGTAVVLYDQSGTPTFVSFNTSDVPVAVSNDGTKCLLLRNDTPQVQLIMVNLPSTPGTDETRIDTGGNGDVLAATMTPDAGKVLYISRSSNLVSGDTNGRADVFLKDIASGTTTLLSHSLSGAQANRGCDDSSALSISTSGRFATFGCRSANLLLEDTNVNYDIFLADTTTGGLTELSSTTAGAFGNADSLTPALSGDGGLAVFTSKATNFFSGDTVNSSDDFLVQTPVRQSGGVTLDACPNDASKIAAGSCGCGIADTDANLNGVADCVDPKGTIVPSVAPTLDSKKAKLTVTLPALSTSVLLGTGSYSYIVQVMKGKRTILRRTVTGSAGADTTTTFRLDDGRYTAKYRFRFSYSDGSVRTSQLSPVSNTEKVVNPD
jgi:hypothetical protein